MTGLITELILFMVEKAIVNAVAMIPAMLFFGYISSSFLVNVGASKWLRILVYCLYGVSAGVWSYSVYDAPDRAMEIWEVFTVSIGMLILCFILVAPIVLFSNRKKT